LALLAGDEEPVDLQIVQPVADVLAKSVLVDGERGGERRQRRCPDALHVGPGIGLGVLLRVIHGLPALSGPVPALTAFQIFWLVRGMSRWVTPKGESASRTAFTMAAGTPIVPASPTPLAPRGLVGEGVSSLSMATGGTSAARG